MPKKRRKKKKKDKKIKSIIGIDETNGGFHIDSFNSQEKSSLIMTGYLTQGINRANYGSSRYEHKSKLIKESGNLDKALERALERGVYYLNKHPDYIYTTIPKDLAEKNPLAILKGNAAALLVFEFFLRYNLKPEETAIVLDETDGESNSESVNYILNLWLEQAGLKIPCRYKKNIPIPEYVKLPYPYIFDLNKKPYRSKRKADNKVVAVRKADRAGYYLTAIHLLGNSRKWPHRSKKVNLNDLEQKCIEVIEKINNTYVSYSKL